MNRISSWFSDRIPLAAWRESFRRWGEASLGCRWAWPFTLEGLVVFLFLVEAVTGIFLAVYYRPTDAAAYESVRMIEHRVHAGWAIRQIHLWGTHLLAAAALLWLLRGMFRAEYRRPREIAWWLQAGIVFAVLASVVTGEILPWTQHGFHATVVRAGITGSSPGIGPVLRAIFCGGASVGEPTLVRFYAAHLAVLPGILAVLLALRALVLLGLGPAEEHRPGDARRHPEGTGTTLLACVLVSGLLAAAAILLPWRMDDPADPLVTPAGLRPDWYFIALHGLLVFLGRVSARLGGWNDQTACVVLTGLVAAYVALLPFLDPAPGPERRARKWALYVLVAGVGSAIGLGWFGMNA